MKNTPVRPFTNDPRRKHLAFVAAFAFVLGFRLIEFTPLNIGGWLVNSRMSVLLIAFFFVFNMTSIDAQIARLGNCSSYVQQIELMVARELRISILISLGFSALIYALIGLLGG